MIALFDFDGVIMDTETQYTQFWNRKGKETLGLNDFGFTIKGQTLKQIFSKHYSNFSEESLSEIEKEIDEFEKNMEFGFISGAEEFLAALKKDGIPTAIVTSSNEKKMRLVYDAHPKLNNMVDAILTSEHFKNSKPDPECFLKGMEILGGKPEETIIFEDSLHGIEAGRKSGAFVVGVATTNSRETISPLCDVVIDDFKGISFHDLKLA